MNDYERALDDLECELRAHGHAGSCAACNGVGRHAGATCSTCHGYGDPVLATLRRLRGVAVRPVRHAGHFQAAFGEAPGDGDHIEAATMALNGATQEAATSWSIANVCFALETSPHVFEAARVLPWLERLAVMVDRVLEPEDEAPVHRIVAEA